MWKLSYLSISSQSNGSITDNPNMAQGKQLHIESGHQHITKFANSKTKGMKFGKDMTMDTTFGKVVLLNSYIEKLMAYFLSLI